VHFVKINFPHHLVAQLYLRVHDLKPTFGRGLRAAGVSFEDRQDLLGHRLGRITTHYSSAELENLYQAANRVCERQKSGVVLTLLRNSNRSPTRLNTQGAKNGQSNASY
jgi:hypothetical protein